MTTKRKRVAQQGARPPIGGMLSAPETAAGLIVKRTLGEDETFGHCSHAMQLLPNGAVLVLVTSDGADGGVELDTYLLGEEVPGFKVLKSMIETSDAPA